MDFMKKIFLLFLFGCSNCLAQSVSWSPINWLQNILLGQQYEATQAYKQQDYDLALIKFHDLMNNDPYNSEYNYNVGDILYKQQKYSDAKKAFLRAIDHARKTSKLAEQAYFNMGNSCYQLEEWHQAVDAYEQALKINEKNEQSRHNLQLALYKLQEQQSKDKSKQNQPKDNKQSDQSQNKKENQSTKDTNQSENKSSDGQLQGTNQENIKNNQQKKSSEQSEKDQKNMQKSDASEEKQSDLQGADDNQKNQDRSENEKEDQTKTSDDQAHEKDMERKQSSKNQLQDIGDEKQNYDDMTKKIDNTTQQANQGEQAAHQDMAHADNDKKEMGGYKKPELKNQLQDQYESKACDDERLTDYHASVMKTLEDFEEEIQKRVIKNKVAMQGPGQNGKKGW